MTDLTIDEEVERGSVPKAHSREGTRRPVADRVLGLGGRTCARQGECGPVTRADLMRKASEVRAYAEAMVTSELRWLMLDIARQYEELAEQVDQLDRLNDGRSTSEA
jgi:hypothetical protein